VTNFSGSGVSNIQEILSNVKYPAISLDGQRIVTSGFDSQTIVWELQFGLPHPPKQ
jgi:hypothetical protein